MPGSDLPISHNMGGRPTDEVPGYAGLEVPSGAVSDTVKAINDPSRLSALKNTKLMNTPPEQGFDQLTRVASHILNAPIAVVSLVDQTRQFFKSRSGELPSPWFPTSETPLSYSFCKHAVASRQPLVINDARSHPLMQENPAIRELGVEAYAGIPLILEDGNAIGTLCVMDSKPRYWSADQIEILQSLASAAVAMIAYRSLAVSQPSASSETRNLNAVKKAGDRFAQKVSDFLDCLTQYDLAVSVDTDVPLTLEQEVQCKAKVESARGTLAQAAGEFGRTLAELGVNDDPEIQPALEMLHAYTEYAQAEQRRNRVGERFRALEVPLSDVKHEILLTSNAEQALRMAERQYAFSRD